MIKIVAIALLIIISGHNYAQRYDFRNYNTSNGFSQEYVYHISQKSDGSLLLSTEGGLVSFNGLKFSPVTGQPTADIATTHLVTDHRTWVNYFNEGLFSSSKKQLKPVHKSLANVNAIVPSKKHIALLATASGLVEVDANKKTISTHLNGKTVNTCIKVNGITIAGTNDGLSIFTGSLNQPKGFGIRGEINNPIVSLTTFGKKPFVWALSSNGLLYGLEILQNKFQLKTTIDLSKIDGFQTAEFNTVHHTNETELWVSSLNGGIIHIRFETDNGTAYSFQKYTTENGLASNDVKCLFTDSENNLWIGFYGKGLSRLKISPFILFDAFKKHEKYITAIGVSAVDGLWLGNKKGFLKYIPGVGPDSITNAKLPELNDQVNALHQLGDWLYIGTENKGCLKWNTKTNEVLPVKSPSAPTNNSVKKIISSKGGSVFIATHEGLLIHDNTTGTTQHLTTNEGLVHNVLSDIFLDEKQRLWFAANGAGLFVYVDGEYTVYKDIPGLRTFNLTGVTVDPNENVWFATDGDGVFKYDGQTFKNFSVTNGLSANYGYGIISINEKIWVTHRNGISGIDINTGEIKRYAEAEGLLSPNINQGALIIDNANNLWMGSSDSLVRFQSHLEKVNSYAPKTSFVKIELNNKAIPINEEGYFDYDTYTLKVNFIGISHQHPEGVTYKYMLIGRDKEWRTVNFNNSVAKFSGLEEGSYTFKVIACNSDGICNEKAISYTFHIAAPFWQKTWFIVLVTTGLVSLVYLLIIWRTRILRHQKIILERLVNTKTLELRKEKATVEQVNKELKTKNKDITDSINYAKRIQDAILPKQNEYGLSDEEHFIYYVPKDIVSGDFYWIHQKNDYVIVAAVDCTGHGVPGALMSMIGTTLLNKIVNEQEIINPVQILTHLNQNVIETLSQTGGHTAEDGMDVGILVLNKTNKTIHYAGASRPLYIVAENELTKIEGSIFTIGGSEFDIEKSYHSQQLELKGGEMLYLTSDGYIDQFGGPKDKKFRAGNFKKLLTSIATKNTRDQLEEVDRTLQEWKGLGSQTDDIMVIGIRVL